MEFSNWLIKEELSLKGSFKGSWFQRLVAAMYVLAPEAEPEALKLYHQKDGLTDKIAKQFKQLQSRFTHQLSKDDPFQSSKELIKHIDTQKEQGKRKPSVPAYDAELGPNETPGKKGHPAWTKEEDSKFGWVHDLLTHYQKKLAFDARGEARAYLTHIKTLPPKLAPIMFTEVIAQTSYYYIYGDFPKQKATILNDFDFFNVGKLNPSSKLNKFFEYKNKELKPKYKFNINELSIVHPNLPTVLKEQEKRWNQETKPKHKLDTITQDNYEKL